jgi:hypothetical protein
MIIIIFVPFEQYKHITNKTINYKKVIFSFKCMILPMNYTKKGNNQKENQ